MSILISKLVPDPIVLLSLELEELGGILLVHLNSYDARESNAIVQLGRVSRHDFFNEIHQRPLYGSHEEEVSRALMEAWGWLVAQNFLVETEYAGLYFVSRRGSRLESSQDFESYQKARLLPKGQLHTLIAARVYPAFLRGEYDTAIFQAFREVEVAVRQAGQFAADQVGEKLMRAAFAVANAKNNLAAGPLTDVQLPTAEQEAMAHLFAGAFGLYRNSTVHRHIPTHPEQAAEVIMFASQLLRIVDRVAQSKNPAR
ncbi:MAG: TIGR02391 family protein [Bryobacteraceae bacterium]